MATEPRSTARFGRTVAAAVIGLVGVVAATTLVVANSRHNTPAPATGGAPTSGTGRAPEQSTGSSLDPAAPVAGNPGPARSLDELEARWAATRARIVATLSAPGYGLGPDNILRGPAGYTVDLSRCPAGWSNTEGITDTTITLGHTTAQTGALGLVGHWATGLQVYVDEINASGGVAGRQIQLVVKDDQAVEADTLQAVAALRSTDHAFAITTTGTTLVSVRDQLNSACVPQPFAVSLDPGWADPQVHPWTTGIEIPFNVEAELWGAWIQQRLAPNGPVTVAALVSDDVVGRLYQTSFQAWATSHPQVVARFVPVTHPPTASSLTAQMATVAQANPDVVIAMTLNRPCLLAVQAATDSGVARSAKALFMPSRCSAPETIMVPGGATGTSWHTVTDGIKAPDDPRFADDPYLAWVNSSLRQRGLNPADKLIATGFGFLGWAEVEALRIAADLPGGLTRANLLLALHGLALQHPMVHDGVAFATDGTVDAYPLEGAEIHTYDPAAQAWKPDGPALDVNGTTPICTWTDNHC